MSLYVWDTAETVNATEQEEEEHIWFAHILFKTEMTSMFRFVFEI